MILNLQFHMFIGCNTLLIDFCTYNFKRSLLICTSHSFSGGDREGGGGREGVGGN